MKGGMLESQGLLQFYFTSSFNGGKILNLLDSSWGLFFFPIMTAN